MAYVRYLCLVIAALASPAFAVSEFNYADFMTAKTFTLGSAYTALSNDENALFYNPAGLAFIPPGMLGHINVELARKADQGSRDVTDIVKRHIGVAPGPGDVDPSLVNWNDATLQQKLIGKNGNPYTSAGVSYFTQGFALAGHLSNRESFRFVRQGRRRNLLINQSLTLGLSHKFWEDFAIGITIKGNSIQAIRNLQSWTDLESSNADLIVDSTEFRRGQNIAVNGGLMYRFGAYTFGSSIENMYVSKTQWTDNSGRDISKLEKDALNDITKPVWRLGLGYRDDSSVMGLDGSRLDDVDNATFHAGYQRKLLAVPFLNWLGDLTARVGYVGGKSLGTDIRAFSYGAAARILIVQVNVGMIHKSFDQSETADLVASLQVTF